MLIEDWRPKMQRYRVPKPSINGRVFFLEEGHSIIMRWCARQYSFTFENKVCFQISDRIDQGFSWGVWYHQRLRSMYKLAIKWEQLVLPGTCLETWPLWGNYLHGYGESLFNGGMQAPDLAKTRFVEDTKSWHQNMCWETELLYTLWSLEWRDRWIYWA
jgi:hypothetical protein